MPATISSTVDSSSLRVMAALLGIRGASTSGIVRTALALFHDKQPIEAVKYAESDPRSDEPNRVKVAAIIPDDLTVPDDVQTAWAVRVGIGMGMGMSRKDAEYWARTEFKPTGRPAGITETKPRAPRRKEATLTTT